MWFVFLDSFELRNGLLETFFGHSLKELWYKQQGVNCGFGVIDGGLYLFNLN